MADTVIGQFDGPAADASALLVTFAQARRAHCHATPPHTAHHFARSLSAEHTHAMSVASAAAAAGVAVAVPAPPTAPRPDSSELWSLAEQLGIELPQEKHLLHVVRTALRAPLPAHWAAFTDERSGANYYFNSRSGQSRWMRPVDPATHEALRQARTAAAAGEAAPALTSPGPVHARTASAAAALSPTPAPGSAASAAAVTTPAAASQRPWASAATTRATTPAPLSGRNSKRGSMDNFSRQTHNSSRSTAALALLQHAVGVLGLTIVLFAHFVFCC